MMGKLLGGRYQLDRHIGGGGFGQTYLATDLHLPGNPSCVVKQFKPRTTDPEALQAARRLFDTEAEVLYTLGDHEQIPRLFAHLNEGDEFFLVQEFIEGETLSQELDARLTFSEPEVAQLLQEILSVLEFVHQQQVVHRDIKPANLIRRQSDRRLVLIDFGAVKQIGLPGTEDDPLGTVTIAVGSSGYMPNEQLAGKPRFSSDIYAVGMLAIQCLTGVYPKTLREDPTTGEIVWRDRVQVSTELAEIIDTMVRYDYRQRYPTAQEALVALQAIVNVAPVSELLSQSQSQSQRVSFDGHLAWLERGDELFHRQRYREAVIAYDKVIQACPDEYLAWFKRGIALDNLNRYEDAVASYDRVIELQPDDYLAWFKRGNALEHLQRYDQALVAYDRVIALQPDNYWAWHDRAQTLEALQQLDAAIAAYDRAVQLKPDFQVAVESRKRILQQLQRVDALYHLQHYDEAVVACDRAIAANPDDALAWLMRGMALENLNQAEAAIAAYDRVVELQPNDHLAWFKRANLLEQLGRPKEAIAAFYKVVQIQPDNYWAWYDRGRLLEQVQRRDEAISSYDRAVQLKPNFQMVIAARRRLMNQLQAAEPPERKEATVSHAGRPLAASAEAENLMPPLEQDSQGLPLLDAKGPKADGDKTTFVSGSRPAKQPTPPAQSDLPSAQQATSTQVTQQASDSIQENAQRHEYSTWFRKGRALEQLQRYTEALIAYNHACQICPDDPQLWRWRGNVLSALKQYEQAIASYDRALQIQPDHADLWCCVGGALIRLKRYRDAAASFERAIQLNPETHAAWYWRGRVLCELKQYAEAVQSFNQALTLKPDFQPALRARDRIRQQFATIPVETTLVEPIPMTPKSAAGAPELKPASR